jgi:hypothetical protein
VAELGTIMESSGETRTYPEPVRLNVKHAARSTRAISGILLSICASARRVPSDKLLNGIRVVACVLSAAAFLLLSYQFGNLGVSHAGGSPSYVLFSFSAAMTALAVVLIGYVAHLRSSTTDYIERLKQFDQIEGKHCGELFQLFRRPLVSIETEPDDVAEVAASAIREVLKRSTEEGRRVVFFGAASLQTPPKGWVPIRSGDGLDAEDAQSPHQIYQGALEAAASARAHVDET